MSVCAIRPSAPCGKTCVSRSLWSIPQAAQCLAHGRCPVSAFTRKHGHSKHPRDDGGLSQGILLKSHCLHTYTHVCTPHNAYVHTAIYMPHTCTSQTWMHCRHTRVHSTCVLKYMVTSHVGACTYMTMCAHMHAHAHTYQVQQPLPEPAATQQEVG